MYRKLSQNYELLQIVQFRFIAYALLKINNTFSMTQVSQISLSSNISPLSNKQFSSSKFERSTQGGQTSSRTFDCKSNVSKISILNQQISKIEQAQNQMQRKFEKCIQSLIKQIQQKQSLNNKLHKEVSQLKQNIEQSKKDIQTISGYVKKNIKSKNSEKNRTSNDTTNKNTQILGSMRSLKKSQQQKSPRKLLTKGLGSK